MVEIEPGLIFLATSYFLLFILLFHNIFGGPVWHLYTYLHSYLQYLDAYELRKLSSFWSAVLPESNLLFIMLSLLMRKHYECYTVPFQSDQAGTVVEILIQDGQSVGVGQVSFYFLSLLCNGNFVSLLQSIFLEEKNGPTGILKI